jgi:phage tail sheath protein FI
MGTNLAPGVEVIERSFGATVQAGQNVVLATLGLFAKGPLNERTIINSTDQLIQTFGRPDDTTYKFFLPIVSMLDQTSVNLVRVEKSETLCAGLTVGISGGDTFTFATPVSAYAYPLSYDTLFTVDDLGHTQITAVSAYTDTISFLAVGPGTYYNSTKVAIIDYLDYAQLRDLQLALAEAKTLDDKQTAGETAYNLAVSGSGMTLTLAEELIDPASSYAVDEEMLNTYLFFDKGPGATDEFGIYEFETDTLVNAYMVSTNPAKMDSYGKTMFANRIIEDNSINLRVFVGTSELTASTVTPKTFPKTALRGAGALSTSLAGLDDEMYLQLSENYLSKEDVTFTAFVDLDFSTAIKQRMDEICQIRKDCVAILNVPAEKMINISTSMKTANPTTLIKTYVDSTLNINSSYSAVYANYFQVYDAYNDKNRWVPCTGHVANRLAYTFNNFEPWFAIAGLERGTITGVLKVAYNPTEAQRKVLYPARINTIVNFTGEGIVIWGQKTLLSTATQLDRFNVRNLLVYIENALERISKNTVFKQNDAFTRAEWLAAVNPFMDSIQSRRGILEYLVVCDESNNTADVVARNEFQAYVLVRPTPVAEYIKIVVADVGGSMTLEEAVAGVKV